MLTWTTYGSWLQGDSRRYVSDGKVLQTDEKLYEICKRLQKSPAVKLSYDERQIVQRAIVTEAKRIEVGIGALTVCSNHVHLLLRYLPTPISSLVSRFKNISTFALKQNGRSEKIWTKGFDKRFCFDNDQFNAYIEYINKHNNNPS
jgi:REP element-mobilizing transposase RayT